LLYLRYKIILTAALFPFACSPALADTFYMKSGSEIEGVVVSENSSVVRVDIGYGMVNLEKADILKTRRSTKIQRAAVKKEMLRRQFRAGLLAPKGAEKLSGLFRELRLKRAAAFETRSARAARVVEVKTIEKELPALKQRYSSVSGQLAGIDAQSNPDEYNSVVGEINGISVQIKAGELRCAEARRENDAPDTDFQSYLDAYRGFETYFKDGGGKPPVPAPKGRDGEYYAWVRDELRDMKRDFNLDSVGSEMRNSQLFVKAVINGRVTARLMVDTGASATVLYEKVSDALKLDPKDMTAVSDVALGDGRTVQAKEVRLDSITVGKSSVKGATALVMPGGSAGIDGLLGMSFLSHFVVRVDSANGKLILESLR
jgi:clan AA aspartic protease (TIGR02281 family)